MGNMGGIERLMVFGILMIIITILGIAFFGANDMGDMPDEFISDDDSGETQGSFYRDFGDVTGDSPSDVSNEGLPSDPSHELGSTPLRSDRPVDDTEGDESAGGGEASSVNGETSAGNRVEEPAAPSKYTVVKGDSFARIARKVFGDEKWTLAIQKANPEIDPLGLQIGMEIVMPAVTKRNESSASIGSAEPAASVGRYVVQTNDSLYSIAAKMLGGKKHWKKIYEANRDVLSDPDTLRVGMTLRIP
jgi:nucleoid-associated protein YgaU